MSIETVNDTKQIFETPIVKSQQNVHIPSSWYGSRSGSYSNIQRSVVAIGTVEVKTTDSYTGFSSIERKEYGHCSWRRKIVVLVEGTGHWEALYIKEAAK